MSTTPKYPDKGAEAWAFVLYPPMRETIVEVGCDGSLTAQLECGVKDYGTIDTFSATEGEALRKFIMEAEIAIRDAEWRLEEIEKESDA